MYQPEIPKAPLGFKILVFPWLFLLSKLPFWILYRISDLIFVILYHIIKYRRKVVLENLRNSFPQREEKFIQSVERKYYKHLSDLFVETIKGYSITEKQMKKRMINEDQDVYLDYYQKNQSFIVVMSHCGNWEWICLMSQLTCKQQVFCTYKTLSSDGFNWFMYQIRSKFGAKPVSMTETLRAFANNKDAVTVTALIGDQNPSGVNQVYWADSFLNQETAFLTGPAKISKKFNLPIVYLDSRKLYRGHYAARSLTIIDNPSELTEDQISERISNHIQNEILNQPEIWLWSHRRWKHKRIAK
jgi:KDO2-lipid IV(A) lauroyltransferase